MNLTRDRVRSIGWAFVLTICLALTMALTFRVNAVKSQVLLAERQIVSLQREKLFLETEFQARSNQQQLKLINDVEFGYGAPKAEQYIEGERQLANLGKPRSPGAPEPIRVASAADGDRDVPFMISPVTGAAPAETDVSTAKATPGEPIASAAGAVRVRHRLSHVANSRVIAE